MARRRARVAVRAAVAWVLGAGPAGRVAAQDAPVPAAPPRVTAVTIERAPVFDPDEAARDWWRRIANALHSTTHDRVIRRELLLGAGAPFDSARAEESARNLRRLGIFRRALVDTVPADSGVVLRVRTADGFAHFPDVSFGAAGGQTTLQLGYGNDNFLGWGGTFSLRYVRNPDREVGVASWSQPRLVRDRVGLRLLGQARSDGRVAFVAVEQPFFAFQSRDAAGVSVTDFDGDVLRFRDGVLAPSARLRRRYGLVRGDWGHALVASPAEYLRVGATAQLRRDDFVPRGEVGAAPFPASVTGAAGVWAAYARARFRVLYNIATTRREEDLDLSTVARAGAWAAPRVFGYARDGVALDVRVRHGVPLPGGVLLLGAAAHGLWDGAGLDSGRVRGTATAFLKPFGRRHTVVLHAQGGMIRDPLPGDEFDLGLGFGPRGFPLHAFTGDRFYYTTAEYRYFVAEDLLGLVGLGVTGFVDHGGAWWTDGVGPRRGTALGAGVLVGPSRLTRAVLFTFDMAYRPRTDRLPGGWVFNVTEGFTF